MMLQTEAYLTIVIYNRKTFIVQATKHVTYKWAIQSRLLVHSKPLQSSVMKHSSLMGSFLSHEENELI